MSESAERGNATKQPDNEAQDAAVEPSAAAETPEAADGAGDEGGVEHIEGATDNMPPVPDEIREAARTAPDHWFGMVDPTWRGEGPPPGWAVIGQWRSGAEGEIVEWQDNEEYRPSPAALGWPEPADDVDAALQLAATGYGPGEAVPEALAELPEAAVFVTPGGDPLTATAPDGETPVVPLFTSPVYLHTAGRLAFELMSIPEVINRLPEGHVLYLNPSGPVSMTVETDMLRRALAGESVTRPAGTTGEDDTEQHQEPEVGPAVRPATTSGAGLAEDDPAADGPDANRPEERPGRAVEEALQGPQSYL